MTGVVTFSVLVGGIATWSAWENTALVHSAASFVDAGASTYVERAPGRIDGAACDALDELPSVQASGGIRERVESITPSALPGSPVPAFETTRGFASLVAESRDDDTGVTVSRAVAKRLNLREGDLLRTSTGSSRVTGIFEQPDDGRDTALSYAVLSPVPADEEPFDACWARVWPSDEIALSALGRTLMTGARADGEQPSLMQLNSRLGTRFDQQPLVAPPLLRFAAAIVGAAIAFAMVSRRRLTLASDRHVGVSITCQLGSQLAQASIWSAIGAAVSIVAGIAAAPQSAGDAGPVIVSSMIIVAAGLLGVACGTLCAVAGIRERHLFAYFKTR